MKNVKYIETVQELIDECRNNPELKILIYISSSRDLYLGLSGGDSTHILAHDMTTSSTGNEFLKEINSITGLNIGII